ncbi:MAG TPA: hypothetical protein VHM31_08260 [Polyangia bacterium]|nr:hypothetical protein [Polyangia bacterium]
MTRLVRLGLAMAAAAAVLAAGCTSSAPAVDGTCTRDPAVEATCTAGVDGGAPVALGLVGYSCTGAKRPDDDGHYIQGVPQGIVCADQPVPGADGGASSATRGYCCTASTTPCVHNPVAVCDPGLTPYECQNVNRPESYNPEVHCGQGIRGTDTVIYCCSGATLPPACSENDGLAACSGGLIGWTCPVGSVPKGENLGANKSRADQYYLLCSTSTPAPNVKYENYCCFPPAPLPPGGACWGDVTVPDCPFPKFGFACYGPETPPDDYPPIRCSGPGVRGTSAAGYPATLYCCDFE